ncbi:hypothetical protein ACFOY2_46035 [Nonomuraea purpurea]|uniref:Uncharacterized protein n=1 Tax=Nonomuraea purpurea TaxID=1849276 RepID=A0ABV8GLG1_9ACTN
MTHELDRDGRELFLRLSADLYEQATQDIRGEGPRNEGLAFWQAIREAMDAEAEQHKRRMTVYRMLEDLAVYRMAKVQGMPYERIGHRAGQRSRTWAFQHTMPQDLVDDLIDMYAEAEAAERDAFINARAEPVTPPPSDRSVIPITAHAKRPVPPHESARRSLLYRQLRRFLGGAAAIAGPAYLAVKSTAESYTSTVQTALMSNGALTPMPGLDPLSAGGLSSMLSASGASGAATQASGPVTTVVGKVMASAVIGVQATAGVSAPAAVALTAAAGTPVVLAAEEAAKPIAVALGIRQPDPTPVPDPVPDMLAALPALLMPTGEEAPPYLDTQVPTVDETEPPHTGTPTPEPTSSAAHPPATIRAAAPTMAAAVPTTPAATRTATPTATATQNRRQSAAVAQPTRTSDVPTVVRTSTPTAAPSPSPTTAAPTPLPTRSPTIPEPGPTASLTPTKQPTTPEPPPSSSPTEQPPTSGPTKEPTPAPAPTKTIGPEPTTAPSSPGDEQPQYGSVPVEELLPAILPAGAGGSASAVALRPVPGWWY